MRAPIVQIGKHEIDLSPRFELGLLSRLYQSYPRPLRRWLLGCLTIVVISLFGAAAALPAGWEVLGTTPTVEWGLLIAAYVFLAITTSGLCLTVSLGSVLGIAAFKPLERRGVVLALISLVCAFWVILLDLQEPLRLIFGAILSPSPLSPMWWMGVAYACYLVVLLVEVVSMFLHYPRIHTWASRSAAVVAIIAPSTLGTVFGAIGAHALWSGLWTPAFMLASALLSGAAMLTLVAALVVRFRLVDHERTRALSLPALRRLLVVALALVSLLLVREVVAGFTSSERGLSEAMHALVLGRFAPLFWLLRVLVGLAVPAWLLFGRRGRHTRSLALASACAILGIFIDRILFVVVAQAATVTVVAGTVTFPVATYLPSLVEITIVAGTVAMVALAYTLVERHGKLAVSSGGRA